MGQQQLILLVLATVIVGIAIVVGIRAFTENSTKANSDAMVQDAVRMANDAQAWKQKPAPFGGQEDNPAGTKNDVDNFTNASFAVLGYNASGGIYENINGFYSLVATATGLTIHGCNPTKQNDVEILVVGLADTTISAPSPPVLGTSGCTAANPAG